MAHIILAIKLLPEAKRHTASVQPNEIPLASRKTESGLQNHFVSLFHTCTPVLCTWMFPALRRAQSQIQDA